MKKEISAEEMLQQREKAFSVLDRIWGKVPAVNDEVQADIEQAIAEARTERARKRRKLSS